MLEQIVNATRKSLERRMREMPPKAAEEAARRRQPPREFAGALSTGNPALIAEIKRVSPAKGPLRPDLDAVTLARIYRDNGAAAISVLTESSYFKGSFDDLQAARESSGLPVLCKDFFIDPYQVYYARAFGADAVLLIAAILDDRSLSGLHEVARALGMAAIVEVHDRTELERALGCEPDIVGINNRDLTHFTVDLNTTLKLRRLVPENLLLVSESGIHSRDDIVKLRDAGVNAVLVGEAVVTSPDPARKVRELLGEDVNCKLQASVRRGQSHG
ncbi:MAG: indole-3-glycerol phosphate synthase TrpC [Dehalococcoidia bacterium]|nr:indole-3-glycerol phosphate synthase TrpC [Dehalococcoidia bacterium]